MHLFVAVGFFVVIHLHDIYAFRRRFYPKRLMGGGGWYRLSARTGDAS